MFFFQFGYNIQAKESATSIRRIDNAVDESKSEAREIIDVGVAKPKRDIEIYHKDKPKALPLRAPEPSVQDRPPLKSQGSGMKNRLPPKAPADPSIKDRLANLINNSILKPLHMLKGKLSTLIFPNILDEGREAFCINEYQNLSSVFKCYL